MRLLKLVYKDGRDGMFGVPPGWRLPPVKDGDWLWISGPDAAVDVAVRVDSSLAWASVYEEPDASDAFCRECDA